MFTFYFLPLKKSLLGLLAAQLSLALIAVLLASKTAAQNNNQPPSFKQALNAAWQLGSASRTQTNRRMELSAKAKAASNWISGDPVVGIAHRTDLLSQNEGFREYEADIELPLWNPGVRAATQADISAQQLGFDSQVELAKLKLAGELRALAANAATAQVELDLNKRKLQDANVLAQDLSRRIKAGENARVDGLLAQVQVQQAQAAIAQAESQLLRLQAQWRGLTGMEVVALLDTTPANTDTSVALVAPTSPSHPSLRLAQAQIDSARTKLALADASKRDPMTVGMGMSQERSAFAAANQTKLRFALRIPLGGENRNAPRLASARAELDVAQAQADAAQRLLTTEMSAATADLRAARAAQTAASERARLSTEIQTLITKSWQLGNSDLPARLRADNEQFEATLALAKASIDVQRAIANLNQAQGYLP